MERRSTVCRAAYGHVAGYGFSGRGYVVTINGVRVSRDTVWATPEAAWSAYRRMTTAGV
jgi:hypothetical protein